MRELARLLLLYVRQRLMLLAAYLVVLYLLPEIMAAIEESETGKRGRRRADGFDPVTKPGGWPPFVGF